ncbi:hypothetical protein AVEN_40716-1 [Araneus ventricosus]|uniref:DUF4817 domain-containing protein n=1 Tax=Araneus ventricosus TaxID=182803 RepID=A0A4Y2PAN3_ARAVE|nr:hypothetical protein AVEN_40716-1 [Araneus ventricosus]
MPGHFRRMASRWPSNYFLFVKLKEHLSATRLSSDSDVKTTAESWLSGLGRDFFQIRVKQVSPAFRKGRGGLVVTPRLWGRRVPGSRPDSTEDPPCMGPVAC